MNHKFVKKEENVTNFTVSTSYDGVPKSIASGLVTRYHKQNNSVERKANCTYYNRVADYVYAGDKLHSVLYLFAERL